MMKLDIFFTILILTSGSLAASMKSDKGLLELDKKGREKTPIGAKQIKNILKVHNDFRRLQNSSNMEGLTWDSELAKRAQAVSATCIFKHQDSAGIGQNLAAKGGRLNIDPSKMVKWWYKEIRYYNYDSHSCSRVCGHYTQVVWAKTQKVGCGVTECSTRSIFVCNYYPPGNYRGVRPYKKGKACTQCESGRLTCRSGLCDKSCNPEKDSKCECVANCKNCGLVTKNCGCTCKPGWTGPDCSVECEDTHRYCGVSPGWPSFLCNNSKYSFVDKKCPKMCGICKSGDRSAACGDKDTQ